MWTGQDKDTGLIHFGYREYDPTIGRFITFDPIGLAGRAFFI
ncbi:RHS repeat-associated core domain-containing protein [Maridesulfovibrio ferrireducens]